MQAVVDDGDWTTHAVVGRRKPMDTYKARDLFRKMAEAAHLCGDPGIQYDTTINDWHTSSNTDRIHASNPCSEYMFLNDTACNLASLNLMKFVRDDGEFDVDAYRYAAKVTLTAQEILVDNASYPTPQIEENSHKFRPLGLGYANLGALLMSRGLAYDSDEGRNFAATLTAIMHGEAYRQSAVIARDHGGPFAAYKENEAPFLRVIKKHRDGRLQHPHRRRAQGPARHGTQVFDEALELGEQHGYRNAQVTVLAPTGTIAFMMDCDTTGVEPDIALIKYKKLVGEGFLKIVNQTVPAALRKLGYGAEEVEEILAYLNERETIEGAPHLKAGAPAGLRLRVQAGQRRAVHPLHGPRPDDGRDPAVHLGRDQQDRQHARGRHGRGDREGLPRGLEAGPQGDRDLPRQLEAQPAAVAPARRRTATRADAVDSEVVEKLRKQLAKAQVEAALPHRRRLPAERAAVTHKFDIAGHEGYITVGLYPDGQPGEIFLKMAKEGSTVCGLMDSLATTVSLALQYGVPLQRPGQQVRPRPVRAERLHRQPGDPDRQVDRGLHLPVARVAVPVRRRQGEPRPDRPLGGRGEPEPASRRRPGRSANAAAVSAGRATDAGRWRRRRAAEGRRHRHAEGHGRRGRAATAAAPKDELAVIATNGQPRTVTRPTATARHGNGGGSAPSR